MARTKKEIAPDTLRKPSGLKSDGTPNSAWIKFEERINNFDQVDILEWKVDEMFGYLLKRFKDHYQIDMTLSYSGPPSKCKEIYLANMILTKIGTKKGTIFKSYVDWVFDTIIIPRKVQLSSLAFFTTPKIINDFKMHFRKLQQITKSTELPNDYLLVAQNLQVSCSTYGDLAFIKMALDSDPYRADLAPYHNLLKDLKEKGFSEEILNNIAE